ncbi:MAG TPA: VCBS repeat-containing protein [Pyrinomonadaceae bacterium]|nr:VCBS repeat-containing protein [Pyrinomonadaceae bacterium]
MNKFYGAAAFAFLVLLLTANIFAQCRGVGFESSTLGTFPNAFIYRTALDFNGDGLTDFAGNTDTVSAPTNNVGIFLNNGAGGLTPLTLTVGNGAFGSFFGGRWADYNGDGRPDFLAYYSNAPDKVIFFNNGNNALIFGTVLNFATASEYIAESGDVNADGREDFITRGPLAAGTDEPTYFLYTSNGNGTYNAPVFITAEHAGFFIGDFNGDGRKDIAIRKDISNTQNYTLRFRLQNADGSFTETAERNMGRFRVEGVEEFNHDGTDDFFGTTSFSTTISILLSNPSGVHTASDFPAAYKDGSYRIYFGDFNGDGHKDILDSGRATNATFGYSALFGNSAGNFRVFSRQSPLNDQNVNIVGKAFDFTGDGKDDIVRFTSNIGTNTTTADLLKTVCVQTGQTKTIDFDGDRKTDLTFWNASTGRWTAKLSSQPNAAPQTSFFGNGALGDIPAVGDYDGDGRSDTAVFRASTGDWYILRSSDNAFAGVHFGADGDTPTASDYDGDGKTDVAVYRESAGDWYILQSQNGQFRGVHFGANGDRPVQSDFDGDSKTDIAVFRPAVGTWFYLKSSTSQFTAFNWGVADDKTVAADYDGDGKSDIAVYRPSSGTWYVFQSSNGAFTSTRWGTNGDIPFALDTDGNGTFEFTVYRPNTNQWFTFPSTATAFGSPEETPLAVN